MHLSQIVTVLKVVCFFILLTLGSVVSTPRQTAAQGTLFIVGGGARASSPEVMDRVLAAAGGPHKCRVAIFPTASVSLESAQWFSARLQKYQVPPESISILDIHVGNAAESAYDSAHVKTLSHCNLVYFTGGVQERITKSLLQPDGKDTPVLAAVRELLKRGGVLAGSSAGAAMQSAAMISVAGLPNEVVDEGMDALDFGVSHLPNRRGLLARPGLAFFQAGIIDQHFGQYRGRLGRLSRALFVDNHRYGFGIDENTALIVPPSGLIEVCGEGYLTIVDAKDAKCTDGPLGCQMQGLRISCLGAGDQFNPTTGEFQLHKGKEPLKISADTYRGNTIIADIAGEGAVSRALLSGLADNTSRQQVGVCLRYSPSFGHGYRFTFRKTERSLGWGGEVGDAYRYAVKDIDLSIEPVLSSLQHPQSALPVDLPEGPECASCQALWFRGVLHADAERRLHPSAPITRVDFALAMAQAIHLLPPLGAPPPIADLTEESPNYDAVTRVLEAKLLELDSRSQFRPSAPVSRQEAAQALLHLYERNRGKLVANVPAVTVHDISDLTPAARKTVHAAVQAGLLSAPAGQFRPQDSLTRQATADALCRILGFQWQAPLSP